MAFHFDFEAMAAPASEKKPPSLDDKSLWENTEVPDDVLSATADEIANRTRAIDNEIRILKSEVTRLAQESKSLKEQLKENQEKIKMNRVLPYLVGHVVEVRSHPFDLRVPSSNRFELVDMWVISLLKRSSDPV